MASQLGYATAIIMRAAEVAAIPTQLISNGFCFISFIPMIVARAGPEAMIIPTLLSSKFAIANMKVRFADISQIPESRAYLSH